MEEDTGDFGPGPLGPANAILVMVTAVALGTAALLALTHEGGSARTTVHPEIEIEAVGPGFSGRKELAAQDPVVSKPQVVVYIVRSEADAAELEATLRLREALSHQFPDYARDADLATAVVVAGVPTAWPRALFLPTLEDSEVMLYDFTGR